MDPLSDVLALLKPQSYLTAGLDAGGDWAIRFDNHTGTIKCYAVTGGACWLRVDGVDEGERLPPGDWPRCMTAGPAPRLPRTIWPI